MRYRGGADGDGSCQTWMKVVFCGRKLLCGRAPKEKHNDFLPIWLPMMLFVVVTVHVEMNPLWVP